LTTHISHSFYTDFVRFALRCHQAIQQGLFVMHLLESIGSKVKKPIPLRIDNAGARFLMNNWSTGRRTKHMVVWLYWVRELKDKKIVEIKYVNTKQNKFDLYTKNLPQEDHELHTVQFCGMDDPYIGFKTVTKKKKQDSNVAQKEDVRVGVSAHSNRAENCHAKENHHAKGHKQ